MYIGDNNFGDFMAFIGFFTENKKENELRQMLKKYFETTGRVHTIIAINEKNIENMKNIKFDILIMDANVIGNTSTVQRVILNAKLVIINTDLDINLKCVKNLQLRIISYGLNSKSTVTVSSVNEDVILVSVQRSVKTLKDNIIEPQEIKIMPQICHNNLHLSMILAIFSIIFDKI